MPNLDYPIPDKYNLSRLRAFVCMKALSLLFIAGCFAANVTSNVSSFLAYCSSLQALVSTWPASSSITLGGSIDSLCTSVLSGVGVLDNEVDAGISLDPGSDVGRSLSESLASMFETLTARANDLKDVDDNVLGPAVGQMASALWDLLQDSIEYGSFDCVYYESDDGVTSALTQVSSALVAYSFEFVTGFSGLCSSDKVAMSSISYSGSAASVSSVTDSPVTTSGDTSVSPSGSRSESSSSSSNWAPRDSLSWAGLALLLL